MAPAHSADRLLAKNRRLQGKVQLLETMVENRTRAAYLEQERLRSLITVHRHCQAADDAEQLLAGTLDILLDRDFLRPAQRGSAYTVAGATLVRVAARNLDAEALAGCDHVPFGQCLCGRAAASGTVVFGNEECDHGRLDLTPHCHYCVPVVVDARTLALFQLCIPGHMPMDPAEADFFSAVADTTAAALLRLRHRREIEVYQQRLEGVVREKTRGLEDAEARYWQLFENAVEGLFRTSVAGQILDCNPAFARMLGYGDAAAIIAAVTDIAEQLYADPADRDRLVALLEAEGRTTGFAVRKRCRDGAHIWVELSARLVAIGDRADWVIEGMATDITRRREAEDALAAEKERLAVTLRSIGDGVITTDTDGRVTLVNRVAETLTGWSQEEARDRHITEVFRTIDQRTRVPCENPLERVFATSVLVGLTDHTALIARDGSERTIVDSGAPIRDRENRVIGAVLVFHDVTHQHRMEEELRRVKKLESLGVLAGGIAHDFNNILTVLMGNISLVRRLVGEDDPIHVMMTDAEKATLRARRLTHQLLTFAKGGEPVKETANIAEVVRESAEFILQGTAAACCYDLPNDLWLVDIDRGQIGQVVQNIVLNASQAMPGGGGITISGRTIELPDNSPLPLKAGRYVRITVRDTGIGIPDLQLEKIFDPYFTTKQQGSGLGLAITQSIIRKHSGHVEASSVLGEGTAFSVFLPASRTDVTDLTPPPTDQAAAHEGRILVMDDEAVVRKTSVAMLNHLGYEAEEASDGGDVLRRVQAAAAAGAPFDAVIMDLTVPGGIGGVETVRHLRQAGVTARLVASSGYCNDPVMAAFHEYGFDGAVPKPYVVEEMADALRRVLRGKK